MANGFTESYDSWAEGQGHKAAVLKRGNELLEQYGEIERDEFSEAIGQDIGLSTEATDRWVGQLSNPWADSSPWHRAKREKKEYISFNPVSEAPRADAASANKSCVVRLCNSPRAKESSYCEWHGETSTQRGKGAANA